MYPFGAQFLKMLRPFGLTHAPAKRLDLPISAYPCSCKLSREKVYDTNAVSSNRQEAEVTCACPESLHV